MSEEKADIPVASPTEVGEKQGAKYCFCCCDLRRAVIVLAIIGLVGSCINFVMAIIAAAAGTAVVVSSTNAGDEASAAASATAGSAVAIGGGVVATFAFFRILFFVWQLVSAIKYNVCMLSTTFFFQCVSLVLTLLQIFASEDDTNTSGSSKIATAIATVVFWCIIVYPTIGLIMEIKKGIMSVETYPREAYSCCCSPKV